MATIILTGTVGIEFFIVKFAKLISTVGIFPDPFSEGFLDQFLLALGNGSFFLVENCDFSAVAVLHIIKDSHIPEIQRFFQNLIAIDASRAVGVVCLDIGTILGLF